MWCALAAAGRRGRSEHLSSCGAVTSTSLIVVAGIYLLYATFSRRLERTPLTAPIVFVGAGLLVGAFALWNGWALVLMAKNRTAVLPGGPTLTVLDRGPFRVSRNPLYLGLLALHAGIALLWPSFWALVAVPVSAGLLLWGAIVPEEQYLKVKFGAEYERYAARVRRWL